MDHYPGSAIVDQATEALRAGRAVALIIKGLSEPVKTDFISKEGPFANCRDDGGYWLVRLDALVGYRSWIPA